MTRAGWSAIVLERGQAHLASGLERSTVAVPSDVLDRPAYVLDRAARLIQGHGAGVLVLDGGAELVAAWGRQAVDVDRTGSGRVALVDDDRWHATEVQPWTTWRRVGAPAIHVAFLGALDAARTPLFAAGDPRAAIAARLAWYHDRVGAPFFMTPGVAGHAAIRAAFRKPGKGAQPYWGAKDWRESDDRREGLGDLQWRRAPLRVEVTEGWVHAYDLNAARLSAIGVAEVGWSRLSHTGAIAFDPELAGYWAIHAADVRQHPRHTPLISPSSVHDGLVWPTTPAMQWLLDQGRLPAIADSWTTPGRRMFRTIAEKWNNARIMPYQDGRDGSRHEVPAVKATYREAAGLMARRGGSIYRPDWYHTFMDRQRVTLLGHIERVARNHSRRPLAVHTDCLWYSSGDPDPARAAAHLGIKIGHALGTFRVHSSTPSADYFRRTP
jgi:hypothetical protein